MCVVRVSLPSPPSNMAESRVKELEKVVAEKVKQLLLKTIAIGSQGLNVLYD